VLGPDGLSRFEELQRRTAAHAAILYAFDLIEHDGEDLRKRPFLDRKAALTRLLGGIKVGILLNEHIVEDGLAPTSPARAASGSRSAIPPASPCSGSGARGGIEEPRAVAPAMTGAKGARQIRPAR
jgi:hypothetical protein